MSATMMAGAKVILVVMAVVTKMDITTAINMDTEEPVAPSTAEYFVQISKRFPYHLPSLKDKEQGKQPFSPQNQISH